ncbi:MAG: serine/threonine protein kinase, partial [Chloroflexota bacterium]|nr:serine/threonine protein kinase [Chloroflexota bacterium]
MNRVIGGRYQLKRRLGSGGMATVHLAHDPLLSRDVAVKLPRSDGESDPVMLERFQAELRAAGRLNHPNIVTIYDGGQDDGQPFLVMEPVEGESLASLVKREGPLPAEQAMSIAGQVAEALAYAHQLGVVHRDVKPQNVLIDPMGRAKVTDFGIAKSSGDPTRTLTGTVIGTLAFMAPEVAAGQPATALADVYSLGVLLYYMLTGRTPFESENPIVEAVRSQQEDPEPPSLHRALPGWLDDVVLRALARDPSERYQGAQELAADLAERHAQGVRGSGQTTTNVLPVRAPSPARPRRRGRIVGLLLTLILLGLLVVAAFALASYLPRIPPQNAGGSSSAPPPPAGKNLIVNGDLLSLSTTSPPKGWSIRKFAGIEPRYFWGTQGPSQGDQALKLVTSRATDTAWVGTPLPVQQGWKLTLAGYLKVTGVPDGP